MSRATAAAIISTLLVAWHLLFGLAVTGVIG